MNVGEDASPSPAGVPSPVSPAARGREATAALKALAVVVLSAVAIVVSAIWADGAQSKCDELPRALQERKSGERLSPSYLLVMEAERLLGPASPAGAHADGKRLLEFVLGCR